MGFKHTPSWSVWKIVAMALVCTVIRMQCTVYIDFLCALYVRVCVYVCVSVYGHLGVQR